MPSPFFAGVKWAILFLIAVLAPLMPRAQPAFSAAVSRAEVPAGTSLRVTFTLSNAPEAGERFVPPTFAAFDVLSGPNVANSYRVVNGRTSSSQGISYELLALEPGTHTIGPARIEVGGRELTTEPLAVTVTPTPLDEKGAAPDPEEVVALRLRLPRDTVYVGEEVRVEVDLYNRERIHTYTFLRPLRFQGLRAEELRNFRARQRSERIDGVEWAVRTLRAYDVYASSVGAFTIGPTTIRAQFVTGGGRRRGFFFAPPTDAVEASSDRRTVTVLPLPPGAPEGFTGAVGEWRFEGRYDDVPDLTTADALTFTLYARGQGDVGRLTAPELAWPDGWRAYPPEQIVDQVAETDTGTVYTRAYEYTLVPQRGGRFTLAPEVSHFDASRGGYVTYAPPPLTVDVRDVGGRDNYAEQDDAAGEALAPYRGEPRVAVGLWADEPWFPFALAAGPLLALLAWIGVVLRKRRRGRGERQPARDPVAEGRRRLRAARASIGDAPAFYAEVRLALERYAEDRLGLPASRQSDAEIRAGFAAGGDDGARAQRFLEARALADRGLYGGGTDEAGRRAALGELEVLLSGE